MDLLDFTGEEMYFDRPLPVGVGDLLSEAAEHYGEPDAERSLLRAYLLAPEHLAVLVALYRFYYYQQRYADALIVADRAIVIAARELDLSPDWRRLDNAVLEQAASASMTLTRFLLLALKGAGYLQMRLGEPAGALERFEKVAAFDSSDRLGIKALLAWARNAVGTELAEKAGGNVRALHAR